jgi:hypothetical protein
MKYIKTYENNTLPDLRRLTNWVRCIKDPPNKRYGRYYMKGNIYKVESIQGDPERAIEEFKINEYLPLECISTITINGHKFRTKYQKSIFESDVIGDFWSYFELLSEEEELMQNNMVKYNI